jgi:hypothetical protein
MRTVNVSSSDTYDEDREKHNDARLISRMNTTILDWFRPSYGLIAIRPVFLLYHACEIR